MNARKCTKCHEIKNLEENFYKTKYGYHGSCKQCFGAKSKESREKLGRKHRKNIELQWLYGFDLSYYEELLAAQNNMCVCGATKGRDKKEALHVDHDHATGLVRGLLCHKCNRALGLVEDPVILRRLADYLESANLRSNKRYVGGRSAS